MISFSQKISKWIVCVTLFILVLYLSFPSPRFPIQPPDSVQSLEKADTETPLRRAYFTNFSREEVLQYYKKQFSNLPFLKIPLPTYRLNYPPEDAQTLIRDQTRSTFLEEIVHPFRESIFINGFKPKEAKDEVWYKGVHYQQKIIVRYSRTNFIVRIAIMSTGLVLLLFVLRELVT